MKIVLTSLLVLILATQTRAQKTLYDQNAVKHPVSSFHAIDASTGVEVLIAPGDEEALAISVADNSMAKDVHATVDNGVLKIYVETDWKVWNYPKNFKVKAYVSYKQLDELKANSGASIEGEVKQESLKAKVNSGGRIELKGTVDKLVVETNSGGIFKGYDLVANFLEAEASSGGNVKVTVNKEVKAEASSGGNIRYKGEAVIRDIDISSGGSVKKEKD
jgi:hypothetical protein